jgi:hypothetical protein
VRRNRNPLTLPLAGGMTITRLTGGEFRIKFERLPADDVRVPHSDRIGTMLWLRRAALGRRRHHPDVDDLARAGLGRGAARLAKSTGR